MKNKFLKRISSFVTAAMVFSNLTFINGVQNVKADEVSKLIISQYIETNSGTYPKGIELWNVSGSDINFEKTKMSVLKGANGKALNEVITVNQGTLVSGEVMVIGTSDIGTYLKEQALDSTLYVEKNFSFNGDDSLQIKLNGEIEDTFGNPGSDPGKSWNENGVSTANFNIQIQSGITTGSAIGWTDPSIRFEKVAEGNDLKGFGVAPDNGSGSLSDKEAVEGAIVDLDESDILNGNNAIDNVTTDLSLSTTGLNETTISWESNNTAVVANDGTVTRPANGNGNATVILTATITKGNVNDTKVFTITVLEEGADPYELYYKNAYGKTGEELKAALNDIIDNHTKLSYDQAYDALIETDRDPKNPNNVILLYTGRSVDGPTQFDGGNGWNREHVWAKSHGDFGTSKGPGTDIHQLRPSDVSVNSSRGHLDFDNGGTPHSEATECNYDGDSWEPRDEVKGDVARILFYMAVRYEGENGEKDLELADRVNTYPNPEHGKLSVLLEWNKLDPVSEFEMTRNNIIYEDYQHNRNPFIDQPEWADEIWGSDKPQNNTILAAREKVDEVVTVEGIATYCYTDGKKVYFQDETAGIFIYSENGGLTVEEGDRIQVTGTVTAHYDVLEIVPSSIEDVKIINSENSVTPEVVTIDQIVESKESMLVKLENLTITTLNTSGSTVFEDSQGRTITAYKPKISNSIVEGNIVDVSAIVDQFKGNYQLKIRNESDVVKVGDGGNTEPGEIIKISEIQGEAHISPLNNKNVKIKGIVTAVANGKYDKGFYVQEVIPDDNDNTSEGIYVDYSAIASSGIKVGDLVNVNGKVYEEKLYPFDNQLSITYIKNASVTIESTGNALPDPIIIGDNGITPPKEIIDNDNFGVFDPQEDAIDFYEKLEGMLVQIDNPFVVASTDKYGQIVVMPENAKDAVNERTVHGGIMITAEKNNPNTIMIDDVIIDNEPSVNVGDKFNDSIVGIMSYGFGLYKVYNTQVLPSVTSAGLERETTSIEFDKDKLTVASYNIENFSAKTDTAKVNKIADSIVNNLNSPDIIGLIEVQDNNGDADEHDTLTDASQSYQKLIDAIQNENGPEYAYTDIAPVTGQDGGIPGGHIRVGFIYRTDRVSLKEGTKGDATTAVSIDAQGNLSLNPGRIDPTNSAFNESRKPLAAEFDFKGNEVIIIANHFCSKGGDNGLFGDVQPPVRESEVQRHQQAQIVNDFVDSVLAKNSDANVVVLGDLNDFEFSETVNILKGGVMYNMIDSLPKNERFTYVYSGNSQVLDSILVTNSLKENTEIDVVHINAEFTEEQGRASDHDPVLAQIAFDSEPSMTDAEAVAAAKEALIIGDTTSVTSDLTLPTTGLNGTTIIWASSNTEVVANDGTVTRPANGNEVVTLIATITKGSVSETKEFTVTVIVASENDIEINDVVLMDINGDTLTEIRQGATVVVKANIINNTENSMNGTVIVKLTESNNEVIGIGFVNKTELKEQIINEYAIGFTLDNEILGNCKVQVYVWDGWDTMNPLSEAVTINFIVNNQ